jgi:hypothetical protein
MEEVRIRNRSGLICIFTRIDSTSWLFECPESIMTRCSTDVMTRCGLDNMSYGTTEPDDLNEPLQYSFVDPDGGPFIYVDQSLKELSNALPDHTIKKIVYDTEMDKYRLET